MRRNIKLPCVKIKRNLREQLEWDDKEANLAGKIPHFCRTYLFPGYKFLMNKWDVLNPENVKSLSSFVAQKMKIPKNADYLDIWERLSIHQFV